MAGRMQAAMVLDEQLKLGGREQEERDIGTGWAFESPKPASPATLPLWHTSCNKAIPLNPSQVVPLPDDQASISMRLWALLFKLQHYLKIDFTFQSSSRAIFQKSECGKSEHKV